MKILVTGGTGFIGSHLCKKLLSQNHIVICIDNNFTGSINNIKDIINNKNFYFIEADIINYNFYGFENIDQIYHLACPASPKAYQKQAIKTIMTNVTGTLNILEVAKHNDCRILLTSTSEVYGNPLVSPQTETYNGNVNPFGPRACYDEGKRLAETLMYEYNRTEGVDIRICRMFNTYGPNMSADDGRIISNFINQCIKNEDLTVYGDGTQTRSFCYIDDMIDGIIKLMNTDDLNFPINLGNPFEITIEKIAHIIKNMTNSKSKIIYHELPQDDPLKRNPDINMAKKYLNWEPKISLHDGLLKTITYFKSL